MITVRATATTMPITEGIRMTAGLVPTAIQPCMQQVVQPVHGVHVPDRWARRCSGSSAAHRVATSSLPMAESRASPHTPSTAITAAARTAGPYRSAVSAHPARRAPVPPGGGADPPSTAGEAGDSWPRWPMGAELTARWGGRRRRPRRSPAISLAS